MQVTPHCHQRAAQYVIYKNKHGRYRQHSFANYYCLSYISQVHLQADLESDHAIIELTIFIKPVLIADLW